MAIIEKENIYQMYYNNGKRYGFFICEETWKGCFAEVLFFKGVKEGNEIMGNKPYHNRVIVYAKLHFVTHPLQIKSTNKFKIIKIYDGGSFRYTKIDTNG